VKLLICALVALISGCTGTVTFESGGGGSSDAASRADADPFAPDAHPFAPDAAPELEGPDASPPRFCGDGSCGAGESCANCGLDCGSCPITCGDGICNGSETCTSCEADCGSCTAACGDAICDGPAGETCTGCADDCNTVDAVCGNGACDGGEVSTTCYADCGPAEWPLAWADWEEQARVLVNEHRAAGTDCPGGVEKDPAGPVAMSPQLQTATRLHSWDMSYSGYFNHTSCNGRSPWQRAAAAGASATGETIGGGYPSPAAMVDGWMSSSGHCNILMSPGNTLIGVGYADEAGGKWTALFR
jgi:hypothetical protein